MRVLLSDLALIIAQVNPEINLILGQTLLVIPHFLIVPLTAVFER